MENTQAIILQEEEERLLANEKLESLKQAPRMVRIAVSVEHIKRSHALVEEEDGECTLHDTKCPVALAMNEQFGGLWSVLKDGTARNVATFAGRIQLPKEACDFIARFDANQDSPESLGGLEFWLSENDAAGKETRR